MTQTRMLIEERICFFGAGSMAEAVARGLIARAVISPANITFLNRSDSDKLENLKQRYGTAGTNDPAEKENVLRTSPIVILAMKPKDAAEALGQLGEWIGPRTLIVSMIAGLSIRTMRSLLGRPEQPIVRTMPNTSSSIGLGVTGLSYSDGLSEESRRTARLLFEAVGTVVETEEDKIDALTGISGSGPAYVYYMMEALMEAATLGGLTREQAREMTVQTVLGAAQMVRQTGEEPAELRRKVTSPNGATQAAIAKLDESDFYGAVIRAARRCSERSAEMGRDLEDQLPAKDRD
ncbi:pyrroline-5-carboxylate reductase [Saccharibacillus alkalitolerans]|uniref:Pyrroline-5-carboxylate reductase n=1 Tax=Saccharibacillus alkalitolerans TaxID=2705290 RepID=A0ABX0F1J8_9BACL|nr:pyrroline-5-carboxylate reductase [Saccharibacillus alkalitolerans]NGZ74293.1 pyrroline-5-carboxylate reductase [Saccharibacillus alkalitolerans]